MMEKKISDFTDDDVSSMEEKIRQMYIERINKQAASNHLSALDDDDIELEIFIMTSINVIRALNYAFNSLFISFYTSIIKQMKEYLEIDKKEVKQKLSKTELEYFNVNENDSTNPRLRKQCCNIFNLFLVNSNQHFVKKLIPDSYKQEEINLVNKQIEQQRNKAVKHYNNQLNEGKKAIETITANIKHINDFEAQYNALDSNTRNMAQNIETINKARQQRAELQTSLSDIKRQVGEIESEMNRINEETYSSKAQNDENRLKKIKEMRQQMIENIKLFKAKYDEYDEYYHHPSKINQKDYTFFDEVIDWKISISIPIIQNGQNSTSIRGGCLVRSQKSCNIINQELSIEDENKIQECVSNDKDFVILNDKKGFLVNFKLQSYEYSLKPTSESIEIEAIEKFLHEKGLTMESLQLCSGIDNSSLPQMDLNQLNPKTANGISNSSLSCVNGSINAIDLFIKKGQDFGEVQYNGTYPFLQVMASEKHDAALEILSKNAIIKDINECTETGVTPLHWSVYYGWNDNVKK